MFRGSRILHAVESYAQVFGNGLASINIIVGLFEHGHNLLRCFQKANLAQLVLRGILNRDAVERCLISLNPLAKGIDGAQSECANQFANKFRSFGNEGVLFAAFLLQFERVYEFYVVLTNHIQ